VTAGFRVRRERLPDDALLVVRGGLLDVETLRMDALRAYARFGEYGVSVLAAPDEQALNELGRTVLRLNETLTVMQAGNIREQGLELRPTFRRPHFSVMLPNLDVDLARLTSCENVLRRNPYFESPEAAQ
jgi:hypothetical protein